MANPRVYLLDNHPIVLDGLRGFLTRHAVDVVGEARSGQAALGELANHQPDMVIMDVALRGMDGLELAATMATRFAPLRVIVYTVAVSDDLLSGLCKAGVFGVVLKDEDPMLLLLAIEIVHRGGLAYGQFSAQILAASCAAHQTPQSTQADTLLARLTPRERDIFLLFARGETVRAVADRLHLSTKTVETHKYNIFNKLSLNSMVALARLAMRHNVPLDDSCCVL